MSTTRHCHISRSVRSVASARLKLVVALGGLSPVSFLSPAVASWATIAAHNFVRDRNNDRSIKAEVHKIDFHIQKHPLTPPYLPDRLQQPGHNNQEVRLELLEVALEVADVGVHLFDHKTARAVGGVG